MGKSVSGNSPYRSFTVVDARRIDGCPTKFAIRGDTGRYISRDPRGAAKKAFSRLCRVKRIRGQCAMYLGVRETTQGASNPDKVFTYKLRRFLLPEPVEVRPGVVREYGTSIKSVDAMPGECKSGKGKSSGRMARKTSKSSVSTPTADSTTAKSQKGKKVKKVTKAKSAKKSTKAKSANKTHKAKKGKSMLSKLFG